MLQQERREGDLLVVAARARERHNSVLHMWHIGHSGFGVVFGMIPMSVYRI